MGSYSLYLRPALKLTEEVQLAMDCQRKWGGMHATLCSFAAKCSEGEAPHAAHGSSLKVAMQEMHAAAMPPCLGDGAKLNVSDYPQKCKRWRLETDALLPESASEKLVMLMLPKEAHVLRAITSVAKKMHLWNARPVESLHITLGPRHLFPPETVEAIRQQLRECVDWRIVIVKCNPWEPVRCVSEDRESLTLEWHDLHESNPPNDTCLGM
eukprot:TRINITY_DN15314_c0_g1_i1.p1 TRINITY_DN15314_c0_g1~~TRINITY_DN15314_c0_g1_i1.p1  ORF type:complete len:211 (-),score=41.03 TRINITY_DN15314_c0_g1_i1:633-1265(-)